MVTSSDLQKWQKAIQDMQTAQKHLSNEELTAFNALVGLYNAGNFGASESANYIQVLKNSNNKNRLLQKVSIPNFVALCEQYFKAQAPAVSQPQTPSFAPPAFQPPAAGGGMPSFQPPTGGSIPTFQPPVGGGMPSFQPPTAGGTQTFQPTTQQVSTPPNANPINNLQIPNHKAGSHTKQWSSATPGYLIFLVDQSGSMQEPYQENKNKAEFTALVINRTINELININMDGDTVKERVFITLIGYGGKGGNSVDELKSATLGEFANNPLRIEKRKQKISDGNGGLIEIDVHNPIFIEPVANGCTPMGKALDLAKRKIENWMKKHPDNPAPVIINISDGLPYDGYNAQKSEQEAVNAAIEIMWLACDDGNPLLFNAHIGGSNQKCICSASENELPDDQAKFLFTISSKIPASYKDAAKKQELTIQPDSKGFVSNADPETFIKFINFGSSGGKDRVS